MTHRLDGQVAIITGAARGTGEATARRFVEEGARVLLADVLDDRGREVAADLGDHAMYQRLDVTQAGDWKAAVAAVIDRFSEPGVLVNNAAILDVGSIAEMDPAVLTQIIAVNQIGPYLGIQAVIEPMKRLGGGSIVNVASIDAIEGSNGVAAYTSSKWGLRGLSKAAAVELGCHGVRVNTVCPGGGSSEMTAPFVAEAIERLHGRTERLRDRPIPPFNRRGELADFANAIVWLASEQSSYVSGIDLTVDGAFTAGKVEPGAPFS
ncbi:MAG: 3alpha(or 20beta)-hydroxysteroid dehydrogenase [Candidatus Aldehydirespiratoraceae bacterium]|jgi:3alpha(or 20beta)-hydroxysteroid dehydrogenase